MLMEKAFNRTRHKLGSAVAPMDYPGLKIVAHSETERFIRSHSAAKESETVRWIESLPEGSVLWDVGANIGAYALIAAKRGLSVVAFEPSPVNFRSLTENIELNRKTHKITPLNLALGDESKMRRIQLSSEEEGAALHRMVDEEAGSSVLQMRGDKVIGSGIPAPDFIKVDTDGGELEVLQGLGWHLVKVSGVMVEVEGESIAGWLTGEGFRETGRWAIPGYSCENRIYSREVRN